MLADDSLACWRSSWKSARKALKEGGEVKKKKCMRSIRMRRIKRRRYDAFTGVIKTGAFKMRNRTSARGLRRGEGALINNKQQRKRSRKYCVLEGRCCNDPLAGIQPSR